MNFTFYSTVRSDLDYEELLFDICRTYRKGESCTIATISREYGIKNMLVEVYFYADCRYYFKFNFNNFYELIEVGKKELDYPANVTLEKIKLEKKLNYNFSVKVLNREGYEKKVACLFCDDQLILIVSQDKGLEDMEIEFYFSDTSRESYVFRLDDFVRALLSAKQNLIESGYS